MKSIHLILSLPLLLASCGSKQSDAPLVTGDIAMADSTIITAYYDIDGDTFIEEFSTDSIGHFTFNPEITKGTDLTLYINGHSYGARIDNGSSVNIAIDSTGIATFSGDNLAESRWLNACFNGYDTRRFKHIPERDGEYVPSHYMAIIDETKAATDAILPEVANDSLRSYYERLGNQFYNRTKGNILAMNYYLNERDNGGEMPEEVSTLMEVDPNDDASRRTGGLFEWSNTIKTTHNGTMSDTMLAMSEYVDSALTNNANKRTLHFSFTDMLFRYDLPVDQLKEFVGKMSPRLTPHQIEYFNEKIAEIEARTQTGDKIPVDPELVLPDGSKRLLSQACEGKVAYIDMWATWCGPCCAQIPYMEKIAEHYKDNDKVICISISCDEDMDAWHKKLAQDNPAWPQYAFSGESGQKFMTALGVNGIPRFIVINPDLTIGDINAPRPQQEKRIIAVIDSIAAR